jgi:hypothetical protein
VVPMVANLTPLLVVRRTRRLAETKVSNAVMDWNLCT